ncbi:hypothetical protein vBVcaS_HC045 [Vibrio phage vB_VcaS_HC]|nr:hypothetical protein vBVcaS_HC045 [Vibrio phage vB_VcaS_HC]
MPENRVIKVRARSLKNAEASYISVVDRGANRLPIRMLKNEGENMFDLDKLFRSKKAEPKQPEVMGVLVPEESAQGYANAMKSDDNEIFVLDTDTEGVKFVSYKQEASLEGALILKGMKEESPAVVVDTAQKQLSDFGFDPEQGFAGSVVSYGFYSNIRAAMNVLFDAMFDILETAEPGVPPLERAQTLLDEFNAYMVSLLQTVPTEAFKMENLQPVVNQDDHETTEAEASKSEGEAIEGELLPGAEGEAVKDEGEAVVEGAAPQSEAGEAKGEEQKDESGNDQLSQILEQMNNIGSTMQNLTQTVESMKSEVDSIKETVNEQGVQIQSVNEGVQKAESAANEAKKSAASVVIDTDEGRTDSQKSEDDYDPEAVDRRNRNIEYT